MILPLEICSCGHSKTLHSAGPCVFWGWQLLNYKPIEYSETVWYCHCTQYRNALHYVKE